MKEAIIAVLVGVALALLIACGVQQQQSNNVTPPVQGQNNPQANVWSNVDDSSSIVLDDNLLRINICLVFDCSGSMSGSKLSTAKDVIKAFTLSVKPDMGLGLVVFDGGGISERVPITVGERKKFVATIDGLNAGGSTPLESAMKIGYNALQVQAKRQLGYGEYHLVVVTDGAADFGEDPQKLVDKITSESPVIIHAIGFKIGTGHSLNQSGKTIYTDAQSPQDLAQGLQSVLAESEKL